MMKIDPRLKRGRKASSDNHRHIGRTKYPTQLPVLIRRRGGIEKSAPMF
jgi:hypothetical protein